MEIRFAPILERELGKTVTELAKNSNANCIVSIQKSPGTPQSTFITVVISIFKRNDSNQYNKKEYETSLKLPQKGSNINLAEALQEAFLQKMITAEDRVIVLQTGSLNLGFKSTISLFDAKDLLLQTKGIAEGNIEQDVLDATIDIALEIARRGREGKKVGTAFILGEEKELFNYTKQLIINPFENREINIKDSEIKESLKEFSQLDGVFIINPSGKVISAGTFLDVDSSNLYLPVGFGTRHRCCAAITTKTNSLAILVSESGGVVKVFKDSKIIQTL